MKKGLISAAIVAATMGLATPASAANVIYTQGFETPALGAGGYAYGTANPFPTPSVPSANLSSSGVNFAGGSGIAANGSGFGFTTAPQGSQVAFLQDFNGIGGSFSISLAGLTAGQAYVVAFSAASRPGFAVNPFTVSFGDTTIGSFLTNSTVWNSFSTTEFTATASTGTLTFLGQSGVNGDHDVGIDAISVAAVPEPATWTFMLFGFALIGSALRRRRNPAIAFAV